ncbi:30S ribosomal protein S4 [Spiroplasma chinense]|uniref:Small ribosomal subunit protein uS4 n=1 Tax=Spiroplasma chinense TaxID=216932 RepID=A0A5B9Y5Z4_9MOLU|nr:30S ribosomal protein S4 [Spiroplasma chinense]QEH62223.1 30S ribosomal protein S4 [Spiroplasma chinense]
MSRYTGSTFKKARRYGFSILENGKEFSKGKKRTTAPGQHGARRTKLSGYGQQMQEKQKVKFMYGLTERQFRNTYARAKKLSGITGTNFLQLLESRLDNVVYRMGLSLTRQGARQLVSHGHILVNGKKLDIPSYIVKPGETIALKDKMQKNDKVVEALTSNASTVEFVKFDKAKFEGTFVRLPERKELNQEINDALIVEWYNRLIK